LGLLLVFALTLSARAAGQDWAGSQACAACHADISASYNRTPMAVSSGPVGGGLVGEKFDRATFTHQRSNIRYRIRREGKSYFFDFEGVGGNKTPRVQRQLRYFVGSGIAARSYLFSVDGFLFEAPVAYYTGADRWDLPPGYDRYDTPYLTRRILPGCLECHASRVQPLPRTQNAYRSPPFLEGGVACERCHGPGKPHIAKMESGNLEGGPAIVNPAKLASELRDGICAQCHLAGVVRVERPGRKQRDFLPGERFSDIGTVFVRVGGTPGMKVTSHGEKLEQSACKRASGARMWCGSCHDPHSLPGPAEKAAWFRPKCLNCHELSACSAPPAQRRANGDDCTACHMPRSPVVDADHVVFTDHSIPRRPGPRGQAPSDDAPLVAFGGAEAGPRDLGLAYAIVASRDRNTAYGVRAFGLLQEAVAAGAQDSETLLYLAELYRNRSDDARAIPLYEQAMRLDPEQVTASAALGAIHMERGEYGEAIRLWNDALSKSPALMLVRMNLAAALVRAGNPVAAQATLQKALEFDPTFNAARQALERLRQTQSPE
jgi:hypothetical protein